MRAIIPDAVLITHNPGNSGVLAVSPGWQQVDLAVHSRAGFEPSRVAGLRALFDRSGTAWPTAVAQQREEPHSSRDQKHGTEEEPYFPIEAIRVYFYLLGKLPAVLGRGELVLATSGAVNRRGSGLVPLMLAENGVRNNDGSKRLAAYLTDEQRAVLEALPPLTANTPAVLAFERAVAAEVMSRGRALAARLGAEWPIDLESATLRYLERELGSPFP